MRRSDIVRATIRRFPQLSNRTIARHLLHTYGDLWDNNLERIRLSVRYYRGRAGKSSRQRLINKDLFLQQDVKVPQTWRKQREPYRLTPGLWLILADAHIPFHEPIALEGAVQAGQAEGVEGVLLNGDWQDCSVISYWPTRKRDFNREIELVIDSLDWLRKEFPKQKIVYKPGNHEYRLPRYFVRKAPELIGSPLEAMETIIGFEERKIDFLDYHQIVMAGKLPILHGHEIKGLTRTVNPARGLFLKAKSWALCSHCHTTSMHTAKNITGRLLTTWSTGCLCDLSPDYMPYANDWNWGFALVNVEKDGNFEVVNRRVLPNGKIV